MVDQTTINGTTRVAADSQRRSNASELAHDLLTLAELQARLVSIDARQGIAAAARSVFLLVAGGVLGLACLPIGLAAAGVALADAAELPLAAGLAIVFGGAVALSMVMLAVGWQYVSRAGAMFDRSRYEWQRNMQWFKQTLRNKR